VPLAACAWSVLSGCAAQTAPASVAAPRDAPHAVSFAEDGSPLPRYRSRRLGLSLPLPDGRAWRIDDHSRPELVATHTASRSKVVVAVLRASGNVGRTQCEDMAREAHLVPDDGLQTLDDEATVTQGAFDTRVRVALHVGTDPREPLVGHVMAFGGFLRKCYVFDFSSEVDGAADEPVLSARLAFARTRIFGGLALDSFDTVPRVGPGEGEPEPAHTR
jgi:hypothetical protein